MSKYAITKGSSRNYEPYLISFSSVSNLYHSLSIYCKIERCNSTLQFTCNDGRCIDTSLRCNGKPDCYDSTDEVGCAPSCKKNITKFKLYFTYKFSNLVLTLVTVVKRLIILQMFLVNAMKNQNGNV